MTHPDILLSRQAEARQYATEVLLDIGTSGGTSTVPGDPEVSEVFSRLVGYRTVGHGSPDGSLSHWDTDLIAGLTEVLAEQSAQIEYLRERVFELEHPAEKKTTKKKGS